LPRLIDKWEKNNQFPKENGNELHFLILDRTYDLITPLLHDFHYESLVVDLVPQNFSPFECEDAVYQKYRYKHIAYALEGIP
jgi:syntaxin-binding protein 1